MAVSSEIVVVASLGPAADIVVDSTYATVGASYTLREAFAAAACAAAAFRTVDGGSGHLRAEGVV